MQEMLLFFPFFIDRGSMAYFVPTTDVYYFVLFLQVNKAEAYLRVYVVNKKDTNAKHGYRSFWL
jgi:hypothetical protein